MSEPKDLLAPNRSEADARLKVVYILHRFPYLTETFIVREMDLVRKHGIDLAIFSLMRPKSPISSERSDRLVPLARYSPYLSWNVVKSVLHFLRRSPSRLVRSFARLLWQTYREPKVMLLSAGLFPKAVHFAHEMEVMRTDHVHAHFAWIEGLAAGVAKDLLDVTFTIHPHAFGLFRRNPRNVRVELENASRVVTISDYHRRYIAKMSERLEADDIDVVHCGIEPERVRPAPKRSPNQPLRIVSVGRAIEKKGHRYLIEACADLKQRGHRFACDLVVGGGGSAEALQDLIDRVDVGDSVRLLEARDEGGIVELLQHADIFALACVVAESGDRDGIPVSLMEAMACEVPVVTTSVSGIPELVDDGVSGLVVGERDAPALADALERLLSDPSLRERLGAAGRAKVVQEFDVNEGAARMAQIFKDVSKRRQL